MSLSRSRNSCFGGRFKHGPALHPEEAEGEGEGSAAPHAVSCHELMVTPLNIEVAKLNYNGIFSNF